jgi:hypothetical protein
MNFNGHMGTRMVTSRHGVLRFNPTGDRRVVPPTRIKTAAAACMLVPCL